MTEPSSNPVSSLLDRLIPPAVLALMGFVALWALGRAEAVPLSPRTAGWVGLGAGLLVGVLLDRLPGSGQRGTPRTPFDDQEGDGSPDDGPDGGDGDGGD